MTISFALRPARPEDCKDIAKLFLISSDGLAEYIWSGLAEPGADLAEVGAKRYAREGVPFSYEKCLLAVSGEKVLGMLHSFAMPPRAEDDVEEDPVLRPYAELEDAGSLYVSAIALYPEYRGHGIGTLLLAAADEEARRQDLPRVSLICFEMNEGAMRLYRRFGYRELDRRALVPHPCLHYDEGDAVLLAKEAEVYLRGETDASVPVNQARSSSSAARGG